jgi:hypothetical protein
MIVNRYFSKVKCGICKRNREIYHLLEMIKENNKYYIKNIELIK